MARYTNSKSSLYDTGMLTQSSLYGKGGTGTSICEPKVGQDFHLVLTLTGLCEVRFPCNGLC